MSTGNTTQEQWIDDFIIELRLRVIGGKSIGDAVAQVREFLADSGQEPAEAFGIPRDYAAQLELPTDARSASLLTMVISSGLTTLATFAYMPAIVAFFAGERVEFTTAQLVLFCIPALTVAMLPLYFNALIRHFWLLVALIVVSIGCALAAGVVGRIADPPPWLALDAGPLALITLVAIFTGAGWNHISVRRLPPPDIIDPLASEPAKRRHGGPFPVVPAIYIAVAAIGTLLAWIMR